MEEKKTRFVMVTTEFRGVFAGYLAEGDRDVAARSIRLTDAMMAIAWGTSDGIIQLVSDGPSEKSKISAVATEVEIEKVTAIFGATEAAEAAWKKYAK